MYVYGDSHRSYVCTQCDTLKFMMDIDWWMDDDEHGFNPTAIQRT